MSTTAANPAEFKFLVSGDKGAAVQDVYDSPAKLGNRMVIRDEKQNKYLVFNDRYSFTDWYNRVPLPDKCFHEVIFGSSPQRLKFDIDIMKTLLDAPKYSDYGVISTAIDEVMDVIIGAIVDELYDSYYDTDLIMPSRSVLSVSDSSGQTPLGFKYSFHIIVMPYVVANNVEANEFTAKVIARLPEELVPFIDANVNKRIQNFRILGSCKLNSSRYKTTNEEISERFGTTLVTQPLDLLITALPSSRILHSFVEVCQSFGISQNAPMNAQICKTVLTYLSNLDITTGHEYTESRGMLMCFRRVSPTMCVICDEVHHKDNSLMITIVPGEMENKDGNTNCTIVEYCRQVKGKHRTIGSIPLKLNTDTDDEVGDRGKLGDDNHAVALPSTPKPPKQTSKEKTADKKGKESKISQLSRIISDITDGKVNPHDSMSNEFEKLPEQCKNVYDHHEMKDYELVPTLAVLAQMKMGKTKALKRYMSSYFPPTSLEPKVIRFVTFRQTFSNSICKDFPDFTMYSDIKGDITQLKYPRVIIQVESLHRIAVCNNKYTEPIDLLILDEAESVLAQLNSGLHKHFNAAFAVFQWMLMTAKNVVCMDANLGDRTYNMLKLLRPSYPIYFHWNRFLRASEDVYHLTTDHGTWLNKLTEELKIDNKIVIPTNSLSAAKSYEKYIKEKFPNKKVMLYSSETSITDKTTHFSDVSAYWGNLDALIFSPTCSAGVSFELKHFDTLLAYFCDTSCDVETCRQMLARVRNIGSHNHYICFKTMGASLPTTTQDIRTQLRDKRNGLYREVNGNALSFKYEANGDVKFYESDYFGIWLESERIANLSKNGFAKRFVEQVTDTGATVNMMDNLSKEQSKDIITVHQDIKKKLKSERCEDIAISADLSEEESQQIRSIMSTGSQDIELPKRLAYEKYQLRETYSWHGQELDSEFVQKYHEYGVRVVYRNLCRILEGKTITESLDLIRRRELIRYENTMNSNRDHESRDLILDRKIYTYQSHSLTVWLIQLCGFVCVMDPILLPISLLETNFRRELHTLRASAEKLAYEFAIYRPNFDRIGREVDSVKFISNVLKVINAISRKMYGIHVKRSVKKSEDITYQLQFNEVGKLFDINPVAPSNIPMIHSNLTPVVTRVTCPPTE